MAYIDWPCHALGGGLIPSKGPAVSWFSATSPPPRPLPPQEAPFPPQLAPACLGTESRTGPGRALPTPDPLGSPRLCSPAPAQPVVPQCAPARTRQLVIRLKAGPLPTHWSCRGGGGAQPPSFLSWARDAAAELRVLHHQPTGPGGEPTRRRPWVGSSGHLGECRPCGEAHVHRAVSRPRGLHTHWGSGQKTCVMLCFRAGA